jgi:A nuclease family of the HNH/ENDO VII superfamily with conserved AHH
MDFDQWTRVRLLPNSVFCKSYGMKASEYLFMYERSSGDLIFKDPNQDKILYRKKINSIVDLVMLLPTQNQAEIMKDLRRNAPSAGGGYSNHHIVPVHLWKDSKLVIAAGIDMNGKDNLMRLPDEFHRKNHSTTSKYSKTVRHYLEERWNNLALVQPG